MRHVCSSVVRLVAIWVLTSVAAFAQPGSGGPAPDPTDPTAVPLDGGASLLLAGGVAYGLNKLRAARSGPHAGR